MAEFPALPLFTDAYLADTRHLTAAQHGAYLLLLMTSWRTADCSLPESDDTLARYACMDKRTWLRNKPVVMAFWHLGPDGKWRQKRLVDERQYVVEMRSKKSAAGQASALKRKDRHSTPAEQKPNTSAAPTPTPSKGEGKPSPPRTPRGGNEPPLTAGSLVAFTLPDWIPADVWEAFMEVRRSKRAANTIRAKELLVRKLEGFAAKGHDPTAVIEKSITSSWIDVFEPKENHHATPGNPARRHPEKPTWKSEGERLRAKYAAEADREEQGAALGAPGENLRIAEGVWEDPGGA